MFKELDNYLIKLEEKNGGKLEFKADLAEF